MLLRHLICVVIGLAFAPAAHAEGLADCAWSRLSDATRQSYVAAYTQTGGPLKAKMDAAAKVLQDNDAAILTAAAACIGRADAPPFIERGLVAARAIQAGATAYLQTASGLSRPALEAAWASAPAAAVQCVRANAAKTFGLVNEPCPDPKAPLWFLSNLGVNPASNIAAAEQILTYFNAKAQDQWAEAFLAKFKTTSGAP